MWYEKQPWLWLITGAGGILATYLVGIAATLLLAWSRGSRFVARSRLRKAAFAPLRMLPGLSRWALFIGYRRRVARRTAVSAVAKDYFGLPAVLNDGTIVPPDLTGERLHDEMARRVASQRPLFVVGPGGAGKSTVLARLAYLGTSSSLPGALHHYQPVLIDAADYSGDLVMAVAVALRDREGVDVGDDRETVLDVLQSGRFLILFDGLSEIFGDQRQAFNEVMQTSCSAALRSCRVIVATRQSSADIQMATVLELQPLDTAAIENILAHYAVTPLTRSRTRTEIESFERGLIEPLLFMMMLSAADDGKMLPSRAWLYERYFRAQLKIKSNDEWLGWCDVLETLAARFVLPDGRRGFGMTHARLIDFLDGKRDGSADEESMSSRLRRMYHLVTSDALGILNTLAGARILTRGRYTRFAHETFEEYFLARAIVSIIADNGGWSPPRWWQEAQSELLNVARFIEAITEDDISKRAVPDMAAITSPCVPPNEVVMAPPLASKQVAVWRFAEESIRQVIIDSDVEQFMSVAEPSIERALIEIRLPRRICG